MYSCERSTFTHTQKNKIIKNIKTDKKRELASASVPCPHSRSSAAIYHQINWESVGGIHGVDPLHCPAWPQVNFGWHGPLKLLLLRSLGTAMLLNPAAIFQFSSWLLKNSRLCWQLPSFATSSWSLSPTLLVCPVHSSPGILPKLSP